jgi:hypothetical protein
MKQVALNVLSGLLAEIPVLGVARLYRFVALMAAGAVVFPKVRLTSTSAL